MSASMQSEVARSGWVMILFGLVAVLFGVYLLAWPGAAAISLTWAYGVVALAEGVLSLFALFSGTARMPRGWLVLYALASIVFGILALMQPIQMAGAMMYLLAAWLIIAGVFRIAFAIRVRKIVSNEWLLILSGVLAIALGLLFAMNPLAGVLIVVMWIGAGALIYGVLQIIAGFRLRSAG